MTQNLLIINQNRIKMWKNKLRTSKTPQTAISKLAKNNKNLLETNQ